MIRPLKRHPCQTRHLFFHRKQLSLILQNKHLPYERFSKTSLDSKRKVRILLKYSVQKRADLVRLRVDLWSMLTLTIRAIEHVSVSDCS